MSEANEIGFVECAIDPESFDKLHNMTEEQLQSKGIEILGVDVSLADKGYENLLIRTKGKIPEYRLLTIEPLL